MSALTINSWIEQFKARFDQRELSYMTVHRAKIVLQVKDMETGEIHLHELEYQSKDAVQLILSKTCK
ncbi:MAG: hypothetical protein Q8P24_16445 [Desulfobacterales bacterium]|nr:hypothetical protein [Desulfobacterales bacterium]